MTQVALFLAGAAFAHGVARWGGLPATPLLLLVGFAMTQTGLLPRELVQDALMLGLTFLLFVVGVEMSPRQVKAQRRAALWVGLLQFTTLVVLGTLGSLVLGLDLLTAVYLGVALTASSSLVVVRLLQQRRQRFEPSGRLVVGVLLVQNVLIILLIPVLIRLTDGWTAVGGSVLGTAALVALAFLAQRQLAPSLARLQGDEELLLLSALAVLFSFVGIAHLLALPVAAGAFLAGVTLSPFPVSGLLRGPLTPVVVFFTAIFFLALGGLLTTPSPGVLLHALVLAVVVLTATPLVVAAAAERFGFAARPALETGLLLSQTSELSLVVGLHALLIGHLSQDTFSTLVLVTVATMVLTPFLAREKVVRLLLRLHPRPGGSAVRAPYAGHVVLLGCGSGGMPLLETLVSAGEEVVVIDDDPEIIGRLQEGAVACVHGDATDPEVLRSAGVERAKLVCSTIRRPRDNERLLELVREIPVLVRVFDDEDVAWVEGYGGTAILQSELAAAEFCRWFRSWPGGGRVAPGLDPDLRGRERIEHARAQRDPEARSAPAHATGRRDGRPGDRQPPDP